MIIGIDAGGSFIKAGNPITGVDTLKMYPLPYDREFLTTIGIESYEEILVSGAGSQTIANWFPNLNIQTIPELQATGLGGAYLAKLNKCIVINIGSGTPILYVDRGQKNVVHLGGTGMGSASLVGLSNFLSGINNLDAIGHEALKGDPSKVNLLIRDIYPNPEAIGIPGHITASNFGKYQDWRYLDPTSKPTTYDLLAGLHVMIAETICTIGTLASRKYSDLDLPIVITGGGTLNPALIRYLQTTFDYLNQKYVIPELAPYGTLHGIFIATGKLV